jgi:hypothetical protein
MQRKYLRTGILLHLATVGYLCSTQPSHEFGWNTVLGCGLSLLDYHIIMTWHRRMRLHTCCKCCFLTVVMSTPSVMFTDWPPIRLVLWSNGSSFDRHWFVWLFWYSLPLLWDAFWTSLFPFIGKCKFVLYFDYLTFFGSIMAQAPPAVFVPYLQNVLLIADINVCNAIVGQGINDLDAFWSLKDEDIRFLCANIRWPGGTIINPLAGGCGQPPHIPNPGLSLGHVLEMRLKMLCYFVNNLVQIQLQFGPAIAMLVKLSTEVYQLKELDSPDDDIQLLLMRADQAWETIKDIEDYLLRKRGASGCLLAAVIRMNAALPFPQDPGFGLLTCIEEMIQLMPHVGADCQTDNCSVWDLIRHVTHGGLSQNSDLW